MRHELGQLARAEGAELLDGRRQRQRRRRHRRRFLPLLAMGGRGEVPRQNGEPFRHLGGSEVEREREEVMESEEVEA